MPLASTVAEQRALTERNQSNLEKLCDSVGVRRDFVPLISHNQRARLIRLINKNNWKEARQKLEKWSATATADAAHQLELLRKLGLPSTAPPAAAKQVGPL